MAIADITLADGQATPVNHTFEPVLSQPGLVTYHDKVSGVSLGYPVLTIGNRLPNQANRNYKATAKIRTPILEAVSTAANGFTPGPTLAYELMLKIDCVIPSRATLAEREDIYAYGKNLLADAVMASLVENTELPL